MPVSGSSALDGVNPNQIKNGFDTFGIWSVSVSQS